MELAKRHGAVVGRDEAVCCNGRPASLGKACTMFSTQPLASIGAEAAHVALLCLLAGRTACYCCALLTSSRTTHTLS